MMGTNLSATTTIAIACLAAVAVLCLPSIWQGFTRLTSSKSQYSKISDLYEDEDGIATEESQAASSDFIQRLILVLVSLVGTFDALVLAILITSRGEFNLILEEWLQFGTWVLLCFQVLVLFVTPSSLDKYRLGIYGSISSILVVLSIAAENVILWQTAGVPLSRSLHLTLSLTQFICACILSIVNVLIPRRPDVYRNEKVVDRQNTNSALGKYTFSWATPLLFYAAKHKGLDYDDLPTIDSKTRSQNLRKSFEAVEKSDHLWKTLFWAHKWAFVQQWSIQIVTSFTNFLPQIALYFILRILEERGEGKDVELQAWLLVIGLGAADVISTWLESWMFFIIFMRIAIPVYEQMAAVIFGKSIRRKDVKGANTDPDTEKTDGEVSINKDSGPKGEDTAVEEDADPLQKSRQSTINLVGVDAKRIADFATWNYIFLGSAIKLAIALVFLANLIGWIPLLAGLSMPLLITPINILMVRKNSAAQDTLMKLRDQKMAVVTEALQGIRQIKFSALERNWYEKILDVRRKELGKQWQLFLYDSVLISIWIFGPVMLSAVSLATYAYVNKTLSASIAFTTISVFEAIEMTLAVIPELITDAIDALVSAKRIQEYLDSPELENKITAGETIKFDNATIAWPSDKPEDNEDQFRLRKVNLSFPKGELTVISGKTGSGKSLLLSCIIGETDIIDGIVQVPRPPKPADRFDAKANRQNWIIDSSIAYVAQITWIENATIRDNILFGLPHIEERYKKILSACGLEKDLEMLQDGELTDIGANGINLSGGQKWRVSLARALYSRAGILILDDIFSAVDATVGRHLYENALTGELGQGRTRILVTHHLALCLPRTKYNVLLNNGTVEEVGSTEELRRSGRLKKLLAYDIEEQKKEQEEAEKEQSDMIDDGGGLQKMLTNQSRTRRESTLSQNKLDLKRTKSHATNDEGKKPAAPKKFNEDEKREHGAIKLKIYAEYIRACGGFSYWTFIMAIYGVWIVVYLARSYWISIWTRSYHTEAGFHNQLVQQSHKLYYHLQDEFSMVEIDGQLWYYLGIYLGISLLAWLVGTVRYLCIFLASIRASKTMFEKLAYTVLRAPLRWLDTVPLGRILNRFTADFNMLDSRIAMDISFLLANVVQVLSVIIAAMFVSGFMLIFAFILLAIATYYAVRYLAGAREVKRLESNAKSPVFEQFGSVLAGIGTIRAFDKTEAYLERMYEKIDRHCQAYWHLFLFNRWMGWRLNMVGAFFATITAALIVSIRSIDASLAGFALSFALSISEGVIWLVRQYSSVELDMNATERIIEYSNITTENHDGKEVPAAWPTAGELEVSDLVVSYAPDLDPVLKGLSFSVKPNERIGVVGRTGAGKSSLTLALFRFLEARSGSIYIDGIDISKIKLYDLRSRLAIIPQDPVLFSGTVRSNLDPFDQQTDAELREALMRVQLVPATTSAMASGTATPVPPTPNSVNSDTNTNIFRSLNSKISEGGLNLSQGQRQLLCLARAIVSRPKIMVLDEATSAVDMETDALIQRSIREEFQESTLIVIAHRLSTIADFDRILVMGEGKVMEFDTPKNLMEKQGTEGVFRSMVEESGERAELEAVIKGSDSTGNGSGSGSETSS